MTAIHPHPKDQRGSATIWMALTVVAFMLIVGLAVDLGGRLHALQRVNDIAAEAARTGAQHPTTGQTMRGQTPTLDPAQATAAALAHIRASGHTGTAAIRTGTIHVTVTGSYQPIFLTSIGIGPLSVTGTGEARLVRAQNGTER